jgi:2-iminobutanoate/2-iminopropanoate deaminase
MRLFHLLPSVCVAASLTSCVEPQETAPQAEVRDAVHLNDYERRFGYSQAVKVGRRLYVSGTVAVDTEGRLVGAGDLAKQMDAAYRNLARTLAVHGGRFEDVVMERIYVTDMDRFLEVSDQRFRYHAEHDLPALTVVEVRRLVDPGFLIAVEAVVELPAFAPTAAIPR